MAISNILCANTLYGLSNDMEEGLFTRCTNSEKHEDEATGWTRDWYERTCSNLK